MLPEAGSVIVPKMESWQENHNAVASASTARYPSIYKIMGAI